jgi:hypothetical protein
VHALDIVVCHEIELLTGEDFFLNTDEESEGRGASPVWKLTVRKELPAKRRSEVACEDSEARPEVVVPMAALEYVVDRGATPPLVIFIHPIVVDQKVRLQQLERGADLDGSRDGSWSMHRTIASGRHDRTQSLPSAHRQVSDLGDELTCQWRQISRLGELLDEETAEAVIDVKPYFLHPSLEIDLPLRHPGSVLIASYVHGSALPSKHCE